MKYLVVMLHGYGSCGENMGELQRFLREPFAGHEVDFIYPNAPFDYEFEHEINPEAFQWFSLRDVADNVLVEGANQAIPYLRALVDEELSKRGLTYQNLIVVGFSQGVMMSTYAFASHETPIKGLIGFSGTILAPLRFDEFVKSTFPVCMIHGTQDPVIPPSLGKVGYQHLVRSGFSDADFELVSGLDHSINGEAISIAHEFIRKLVN